MSFDSEYRALLDLSVRIGTDPLQIQAAGGNTSIKDGGTMWIKASGTWLRDALDKEIMVPVRHEVLHTAIADGDPAAERAIDFVDQDQKQTTLRPSVETVMHTVMPQKVVVHVHCVDTIAAAVREDSEELVAERLAGFAYDYVPYIRPGLPLARVILSRLKPDTDVIVLGNHGLVIAAETVEAAGALLDNVRGKLAMDARPALPADEAALEALARGSDYELPADPYSHAVATDLVSCRIAGGGSLYPDHVVYLGLAATVAEEGEDARSVAARQQAAGNPPPAIILFPGRGVLLRKGLSDGALALAHCLSEVTARIPEDAPVHYLTVAAASQLLDWDAEKYRQALDKQMY